MNIAQPLLSAVPRKKERIGSLAASSILAAIEWAFAIIICSLLIIVHFVNRSHGGALWRDEANTANIAELPTFAEFLEMRLQDSFPSFWLLVLREWRACGFTSDIGLRTLGLIVGLAILGVLWWQAKNATRSPPLCSLLLVGANPVVMHYGDSIRAYGLGTLLMLLTFCLAWRVIERPTWRRVALTALVASASVNTLYHNSFLLLAMCIGATAVEMRYRDGRRFLMFLTIGSTAAASLLFAPRLHVFPPKDDTTNMMVVRLDFARLFQKFSLAVNSSGEFMIWVWLVLFFLSFIVFTWCAIERHAASSRREKDLAVFFAVTLLAAVVLYAHFLKRLSWTTETWYYIPLIAIAGVIFDAGVQLAVERRLAVRVLRLVCCLVAALLIGNNIWLAAYERFTNIDIVADRIAAKAAKEDLIIVNPVWSGITFARYYRGATPWMTLPDIADHRVHRNEQVREQMAAIDPLRPLFERMTTTLQSGHKVWVVGGWGPFMNFPVTMNLGPAPHKIYGWYQGAYFSEWSSQLGDFIQLHALAVREFAVNVKGPVNPNERPQLLVVEGWH